MTPEFWQKVKVVLDEAAAVLPKNRQDFFQKVCVDDVVRREVEALLKYDDPRYSVLESTAHSFALIDKHEEQTSSFVGKKIGNYRIIDIIAAGGMGTVFSAERSDGTFEQKVALKVIKRGMDSDAVLQRFFNERRILASLDHPYIARLLDGGTTNDGVPYFVMELVDGIPLIEFVKQNKLSIDERLILFTKIAAAVTYAHQNLVIHRDLKPSNILVTPSGEPKLLDFGIAKLLMSGNGGLITATQQFILTPDYASPEQIRGEHLSTATDIYSLGVILYELVTKRQPYVAGNGNFAEMMRVICETIPTLPSRSCPADSSSLKGDLDNIVLKALRKEPERRYTTIEQFRIDIQRHLDKLPIFAGGDSWRYRTAKFISRHRYGASMALLVLVTVLAGLGATIYQMNIARNQRANAENRFNDVRQLANSFLFEINDKIRESPIKARELVVIRCVEYLDKLVRESDGDVELQTELATAYEKIGMVQAELFKPGLGKTSDALVSHQKALQIRAKIFSLNENDVTRGTELMSSYMMVGDIHSMTGKIEEARDTYERSATLGEKLLSIEPKNADLKKVLASDYARLGQNVLRSGSLGKALGHYERSLSINREILADFPNNAARQHSMSVIYNYIGYVKLEMLQFDEALFYFGSALEIDEKIAAEDPNNAIYSGYISDGHFWLGVSKTENGDSKGGHEHLQKALEIQTTLTETDPANNGNRNGLADCQMELGKAFTKIGNMPEAQRMFDAALTNYRAVWQADTQNLNAFAQIQITQRYAAEMLLVKGENQRGEALLVKTISDYQTLISSDPNNLSWQNELGQCRLKLGIERLRSGRPDSASAEFQTALVIFQGLAVNSPENMRLRRDADLAASYSLKMSR